MYTCYAGYSKSFEENKFNNINVSSIDKCSVNYLDSDGNKNTKYNNNLRENTIIYKITDTKLDTDSVVHLGCYKRNIPTMGIYNTLPHFIGTMASIFDSSVNALINNASSRVDEYNSAMGTDYDMFGLTLNNFDNNNIDIYAGTYGFDSKHALLSKSDPYAENCNIFYPGIDNFIIFQRKDKAINQCTPKYVTNLQSYNDLLTQYAKKNIDFQVSNALNLGTTIDALDGLFPIKFAVSGIANSKQFSGISVDASKNNSTSESNSDPRTCNLILTLKEGPSGPGGDDGTNGQKGIDTKGLPGDKGNVGYWGTTK
jgi:hypothetical protein